MSALLPELAASPRSDVIPGKLLSPFAVEQFAQAEFEFAAAHLKIVGAAADTCTDRIAEMMIRVANEHIANKNFTFGSAGFRVCCFCQTNAPFLLWLTLQAKHPEISRDNARALINPANEENVIRNVLELIGYKLSSPKKNDLTNPSPKNPSTGAESSPTSENAGSAGQRSTD